MFENFFGKKKETPIQKSSFPRIKLSSLSTATSRKTFTTTGVDDGMKGYHSSTVEPMTELLAPNGLTIFNKMRKNDPVIGGLVLLLESVIRRMNYTIEGENAEFVKEVFENLETPFDTILSEIASFFTFGYYLGEKIWTTRDGQVVLTDVMPCYQPTLESINDDDGIVTQMSSAGVNYVAYDKTLHVIAIADNRSPFGISILRHLYKPYFYKLSIEASEALSIDRDLGGLPMLTAPEGFDFTAADADSPNYDANTAATLAWAIQVVSSVRRDQQQGLVLPNGWTFSIVRGENRATVPTAEIIARYNTEMATGVLANFLSLGAFATTNNANTQVHVSNFMGACEAYAKAISSAIQKQIVDVMIKYNRLGKSPKFSLLTKNHNSLKDIGSFLSALVDKGVIHPTETVEKVVLELANIPYNEEEVEASKRETDKKAKQIAQGAQNAQRNQNSDNS